MTHLPRSLIRQVLLESDGAYKPEAPADAPLGKYAFANVRAGSPKPPPEEDTEIENELYRYLINHFFGGNMPLAKNAINRILKYINQDLYTDIFKTPPPGTLYRGLLISSRDTVEKFLPNDTTFDEIVQQALKEGNLDYVSTGKVQIDLTNRNENYVASWTKSLDQAKGFATGDGKQFGIILCATVEDNPGKWIDCDGLYRLTRIEDFQHEKEVIAVGTIRVNEVLIKAPTSLSILSVFKRFEKLPKDQRVINGNLDLAGASIKSLPEGLIVKGSLDLAGTTITSLPDGLVVKGNLFLGSTSIITLPEDLQVGLSIYGLDHKYWKNVPEHLKDKLRA